MIKRSLLVNIYQMAKMLHISTKEARQMLEESYEVDWYHAEYAGMTFREYANAKRYLTAGLLRYPKYF